MVRLFDGTPWRRLKHNSYIETRERETPPRDECLTPEGADREARKRSSSWVSFFYPRNSCTYRLPYLLTMNESLGRHDGR